MGRRPSPNPRRGILRAAATVVVLTALLIVVILVVSSLSAPSAKAPTAPLTPGPITPIATPTAAGAGTATPAAIPSPTHKKTLGDVVRRAPVPALALDRAPAASLVAAAAARSAPPVEVRRNDHVAWYAGHAVGTPVGTLYERSLRTGHTRTLGTGDALVKPVWSRNGRFLLFVAPPVAGPEGATWTLMQYDSQLDQTAPAVTLGGVAMVPLGYQNGSPLVLLASSSDTSIYEVDHGQPRFLAVLAPQVTTSGALSPTGSTIAFLAPTNCYNCTLEFFDLATASQWSGPSGIPNETQIAWTHDGRAVLTRVGGRVAVVASDRTGRIVLGVKRLDSLDWRHSLNVAVTRNGVRILDTVSGSSSFSPLVSR